MLCLHWSIVKITYVYTTSNYPWKSLLLSWSITYYNIFDIHSIQTLIFFCNTDFHVCSHICTVSSTVSDIFSSYIKCQQSHAYDCLLAFRSGKLEDHVMSFSSSTSSSNYLIPALWNFFVHHLLLWQEALSSTITRSCSVFSFYFWSQGKSFLSASSWWWNQSTSLLLV